MHKDWTNTKTETKRVRVLLAILRKPLLVFSFVFILALSLVTVIQFAPSSTPTSASFFFSSSSSSLNSHLSFSSLFHSSTVSATPLTTTPQLINFQARLTDQNGNILGNGSYNMKFRLWSAATGGTLLWEGDYLNSASQGVTITNGLFNVQLGSVNTTGTISPTLFASNPSLFLEIELPTPATATGTSPSWTEGAMTPRQPLASSPYALNADTVDGIDSTQLARTDVGNTFTGNNTFNGTSSFGNSVNVTGSNTLTVGTGLTTLGGGLTVSSGSTSLQGLSATTGSFSSTLGVTGATTLQGNVTIGSTTSNGTLSFLDGTADGFTGSLKLTSAITANQTYLLPTTGGTICLQSSASCGFQVAGSYVNLQAATPGTAQTGNFNLSGAGILGGTLKVSGASTLAGLSATTGSFSSTLGVTGAATFTSTINTNTLTSTALTFSGANPTISPSTANTGLSVKANGTGTLTLDTTGAGTVSLGSTNATNINVGGGTVAETINIGTSTSSQATLALGSSYSTTGVTLQGGSSKLVVNNSGTAVTGNLSATGNLTVTGTGTSSFSGTLNVTGASNLQGTLTVGLSASGGSLVNYGSTLNTALALSLSASGVIGTASATVNNYTTFNVVATATSLSFTIPNPTTTTSGRLVYINNVGTNTFVINGATLAVGNSANFIWNGTAWTTTAVSTGVSLIGSIDTESTPSANGATVTGNTLILQSASTTVPGLVNNGTQSFTGNKTFQSTTNSTTAFQIQNASSIPIMSVNTISDTLTLGGSTFAGNLILTSDNGFMGTIQFDSGATNNTIYFLPAVSLAIVQICTSAGNCIPNGVAIGDMLYWNGSEWSLISAGQDGQSLTMCNGVPTWSCPPTVTTSSISGITSAMATGGGNVTGAGSGIVTARGVVWSTAQNPTITDSDTSNGTGLGSFTSSITGLSASTTYYVRAYATNSSGTSYGSQLSFTTAAAPLCSSYSLGDTGPGGGTIFYIDTSTTPNTCYEVAPSGWYNGIEPSAEYGCFGTAIGANAEGVDIGTGKTNTATILAANCQPQTSGDLLAATIASNYRGGGYADWFLPSEDEIDQIISSGYYTDFDSDDYWSSTEYASTPSDSALVVNFDPNNLERASSVSKSTIANVRPIRSF